MSIHQRGIGGTPSRNQAAENRANILRILRTYGPMKRGSLERLLPSINKNTLEKYLVGLRNKGKLRCPKYGEWEAIHAFDLAQYTPEEAQALESYYLGASLEDIKRAVKPGYSRESPQAVKARRNKLLSFLSNTPQGKAELVRKAREFTSSTFPTDMNHLTKEGRANVIGTGRCAKYVRAA